MHIHIYVYIYIYMYMYMYIYIYICLMQKQHLSMYTFIPNSQALLERPIPHADGLQRSKVFGEGPAQFNTQKIQGVFVHLHVYTYIYV